MRLLGVGMSKAMPAWTIEAELCSLANASPLANACARLELLEDGQCFRGVRTVADWHRSGAESFSFIFEVAAGPKSQRYVFKAYTPFFVGLDLNAQFERLLRRREAIQSAGGRVPRLHGAHRCAVLEPLIIFSLDEALVKLGSIDRDRVCGDVLNTAAALDTLGFAPVAWLENVRADTSGAFLVDFGSDLGEPVYSIERGRCHKEATHYLRKVL